MVLIAILLAVERECSRLAAAELTIGAPSETRASQSKLSDVQFGLALLSARLLEIY